MRSKNNWYVVVSAVALTGIAAEAQQFKIPVLGDEQGNIVRPQVVDWGEEEPAGVEGDPDKKPAQKSYFVSAAAVDTDEAIISGVVIGGSCGDTQVDLRYLNIGRSGRTTGLDQYRVRVKHRLGGFEIEGENVATAVAVQYVDTDGSSEQVSALLSGAWSPSENCPFLVLVNIGWSEFDPDAGEKVDDMVVVVGASTSLRDDVSLAIDYTFDNDVGGDNDYTLSVAHVLQSSSILVFGVAKEGTVYGSYTLPF